MNIPPFLERLLLSNEAVFKNASLGLSGMNMVYIPEGKTAVILEVDIQPFINFAQSQTTIETLIRDGVVISTSDDFTQSIQERLTFQLQIINDNYSTYFSFNNKFGITQLQQAGDNTHKYLNWNFDLFKQELFIYTDRSLYFNIIYTYVNDEGNIYTGFVYQYDQPITIFSPVIQTLPKTPITFNDAVNLNCPTAFSTNVVGPDYYYPFRNQYLAGTPGANLPEAEYLRFTPWSFAGAEVQNSINYNQPTGSAMAFWEFSSLPLINVKYALINKRPSDYGLTKPGA